MYPRQDLVKIFSTFIQFENDRFIRWDTDPRLRHQMKQCLAQSPQEMAENFWAIYWYKQWRKQPQGLAKYHLMAYLQEVCFWSTNKTVNKFSSNQYTMSDCFQIAISGIDKILKGFDGERGYHLKSYASITFCNLIRELLRQRQVIDICSEWSLLRKLGRKRLKESLENAGLPADTIARYIVAWKSFNTIYVPTKKTNTKKLKKPDPETWKAIALLYNQSKAPSEVNLDAETIEKWLLGCVKAARAYLYPNVASLDRKRPGYDSDIVDSLVGEIDESLLSEMIASEEIEQRSQQQQQISAVLESAIAKLKPNERELLELYYVQQLTQTEIANKFNTKQYSICRQLTKIKKTLLRSLAKWTEETLHIALNSDVLKNISALIDEWLQNRFQQTENSN